jgi:hypothetical protein
VLLVVAYDPQHSAETPVAAALNLVGSHALYGRNWGCKFGERYRHLHFELCYYQAIEAAIELGLERVEAGAQARTALHTSCMSASLARCPACTRGPPCPAHAPWLAQPAVCDVGCDIGYCGGAICNMRAQHCMLCRPHLQLRSSVLSPQCVLGFVRAGTCVPRPCRLAVHACCALTLCLFLAQAVLAVLSASTDSLSAAVSPTLCRSFLRAALSHGRARLPAACCIQPPAAHSNPPLCMQGMHKISRGYLPTATYSNHYVRNPQAALLLRRYLKGEAAQTDAEIEYLSDQASPFKDVQAADTASATAALRRAQAEAKRTSKSDSDAASDDAASGDAAIG